MGGFYAVEPYASRAQIYWQVNSLRFHYPSEHSVDGKSYDLEVQIIVDDVYKRAE
jgi:carbonic anhydrase